MDDELKNMEEKEIWKDIVGYEGYYQVSNLGRVKRLPRHKSDDKRITHNNIRKTRLSQSGYFRINLSKDNIVAWFFVHRLVAEAFVPNPDNLPQVNHKNEDKTNNRAENLEWCTAKYNCNYGTGIQRQQQSRASNPNDKISRKIVGLKNSRAVKQLTPDGILIATHPSITAASAATGVHISQISRHCNGKVGNKINRPIRKYKFEYADN